MLGKAHRKSEEYFTRERKLNFQTVAILILQKSVKSLRCKLNEFFEHVEDAASAGAFTQARAKLNSDFFKDINRRHYAVGWYSDGDYKRYKGYRLLAVDGTKIRLPDSFSVSSEFGKIKIKNQYEERDYTGGQGSVMYDVLNECVIDSEIAPSKTGEIELAKRHLEFCQSGDLVIFDRGYAGYLLFAMMVSQGIEFVCRCSKTAFGVVEEFLASDAKDRIVTLVPCDDIRREVAEKSLPSSIQIRLVKVVLPTGEIEVLATSLIDKKKHPRSDFKSLYNMRWGGRDVLHLFRKNTIPIRPQRSAPRDFSPRRSLHHQK